LTEDIYTALRRHLDSFALGAPESKAILEILRIRFTPEEANVSLHLSNRAKDLQAIAESSGLAEDALLPILEQMADKVLIFKRTKAVQGVSKVVYSLLPTAVGLWETSFAKGERNPRTELLARYWREYYKSGWGKSMFEAGVPVTRVIPVRKSLTPEQEIYPYEKASDLIKQQDYICVLHCPCRKSAELEGKGCGKPTEVCFHFGNLAKFFVEKGYAREISLEEALEILDMTEKAGLVHAVGNSKEMGVAMCSCCTCCCTQMRALKEMDNPNAIAPSRFVAQGDDSECTGCETCVERCWVEAITVTDGCARVNPKRCLGCGLCVTTCPVEAITLRERESFNEPVDTGHELATALIKGRKKEIPEQ
jgi:Na+-translocating ferredoxin:NAD+ oxidoreductase subunit B